MTSAPLAARHLAEDRLDGLGQRLDHVRGVAATAARLTKVLGVSDRVVTAAWLHDIGYAPGVVETGFHSLDGARFLKKLDWHPEVVALVAHHSGAQIKAEERGLPHELAAWPSPATALLGLLTYADLTTSPSGKVVDPQTRITEILDRYDLKHPVHRAVLRSRPMLMAAVRRVSHRVSLADVNSRTAT